jgi:hypothetical protein
VGVVSGIRSGIRASIRSGVNPGGVVAWAVDASSNKAVPADSTEWDAFRSANSLAVATPNSLWLCQESSGNLADSIGSLTLTAAGTCNYQQTVTGWERKAVAGNDGVVGDRFAAGSTVGPSPATTSQTWLWIASMPSTPGTARAVFGVNFSNAAGSVRMVHLATSGNPRLGVNNVNADGSNSVSSEIHCLVLKYNRTGSEAKLFNLDEKLTGTYTDSITDGNKGVGNGTAARFLYGCMWSGSDAEISDANIKALMQAMGFTVSWS